MDKKSTYRQNVLKKIDEYEKAGRWSEDVEEDPPTIELLPDKIDYLNRRLSNKIATAMVNFAGNRMIDKLVKNKQLIIEGVEGIENFSKIEGGAILTCNHFHPFDNLAVWKVVKSHMRGKLWKVIKEGNYTNPPAGFEKFFRHCNTLPLSQNRQTMIKFMKAVQTLLNKKQKILIYPEQSMWWNYKKPRPLQNGAFKLAAKNDVPVLPIFITMKDSDIVDADGYPVQKYTIHFLEPIYPDKTLSNNEMAEEMKNQNYDAWVRVYEKTYRKKLKY